MFQSLLSLLLAGTLSLSQSGGDLPQDYSFDDKTLLTVTELPYKEAEAETPGPMSANASVAVDLNSKSILYQNNIDLRVPVASLTKLMTAYIILEEHDLDELVTVSARAAGMEGSSMDIFTGEKITVQNLLHGILIQSGNDAAVALAEHNAGSEVDFVTKMNETAKFIGLEDTFYGNATGLDYGQGYSTTHDLLQLSYSLLENDLIREIVQKQTADVSSTTDNTHHLVNTNIILGQLGIKGFKTGKTLAAGQCLIALAESPDGHEVMTVILGSSNRFADSRVLIDWIYRTYSW